SRLPTLSDVFVNLKEGFLQMTRRLARLLVEFEDDVGALSQAPHRFDKGNILVFLNELEHVATLVTAEAMENLPVGIDMKARRFLLVKRTQGNEVRAGTLQTQITPDDINDVTGAADLFEGRGTDQAGHPTSWPGPISLIKHFVQGAFAGLDPGSIAPWR